jgi:DNA-binding response OmpR family regulator
MKVVLIEDEEGLNIALSMFLKSEGYEVYSFSDLTSFFEKHKKIKPDLIISDINLPDGNFLEELKSYEELKEAKIMIISGNTEIENIKKSFNLGAEDFIKKPFDYEEIAIRIQKAFKNANELVQLDESTSYDFDAKAVVKNGEKISLTKKEAMLLEVLIKHRGKVLTNEFLIDYIWEEPVNVNTLNVLVKRLRQKLQNRDLIKTKRDLGYVLE